MIREEYIGDAIEDIKARIGVLQRGLGGDTVLEEDVMIFQGLLGGQPGTILWRVMISSPRRRIMRTGYGTKSLERSM